MIVRLAGREVEDVLLDRFDDLVEKYNDLGGLPDDEDVEIGMLEAWNDAYLDYVEKLNEVLGWYEENGIEFA